MNGVYKGTKAQTGRHGNDYIVENFKCHMKLSFYSRKAKLNILCNRKASPENTETILGHISL